MSGIEQQPCCCGENLYPCCVTCDFEAPCTTGGGLTCVGYNPTVEGPPVHVKRIVRTCAKSVEDCVERGRTICGMAVAPTVSFNTEIPCVDGAWPEDLETCVEECNHFCNQYGCVECGSEAIGCIAVPCTEACVPPNCPPEECCSPPPQDLCCCITIEGGLTVSWSCSAGSCTAPDPDEQLATADGTHCFPVTSCAGCDCADTAPGVVLTCNIGGCGCCCGPGGVFQGDWDLGGGLTCGQWYPSGCNCLATDPCLGGAYCTNLEPPYSPFCTGDNCYFTVDGTCSCTPGLIAPFNSAQFAEGNLTKGLIVDKTGTMQFNSVFLFGYGEQHL